MDNRYYYFLIVLLLPLTLLPIIASKKPNLYSNLSGRMLYMPEVPPQSKRSLKQVDLSDVATTDLAIAQERNRRIRLWQLQRATRRRYGSYNYHHDTSEDKLIGTTEDTKPL